MTIALGSKISDIAQAIEIITRAAVLLFIIKFPLICICIPIPNHSYDGRQSTLPSTAYTAPESS